MKKTRKLLCFTLSLLMVLCLFPVTAQALVPPSGDGWSLDENGTLTITSDAGMNDWLTSMNGKINYNDDVKNVAIGGTTTTIDDNAFPGLSNLASVTIGNSVTSIGDSAFTGCVGLTSVDIPDFVTTIGAKAFDGCEDLTNLDIPTSVTTIGDLAFSYCENLECVIFKGTTPPTVGVYIFNNDPKLKIFVPADSWHDYWSSDLGNSYHSQIYPKIVAITKNNATTYYPTLTDALAAAQNGNTVTLLGNTTQSAIYTISADKTVTIDGAGYTVTGDLGTESIALSLSGTGTVILKDLTLQGGTAGVSKGLEVSGSVNVESKGTVAANGAECPKSYGLINNGSGTVNVTTVSASAIGGAGGYSPGYGVYNAGTGTVNVRTAAVLKSAMGGAGVYNESSGTVNVGRAEGANCPGSKGVCNVGNGTVNAGIAAGDTGVENDSSGVVNVSTATKFSAFGFSVYYPGTGTVNAGTVDGTIMGAGTVNMGASTSAITLSKGTDATCVLDSITVASTGTTNIGTLPSVCKNGVYRINGIRTAPRPHHSPAIR